MYDVLQVGEAHPTIPAGQPDAVRFAATDSGIELIGAFSGLKKKDVLAWSRGRLRLGLLAAGHHTAFILYDLDGFCRWSDAPFSVGLTPAGRRELPAREPLQRRLLLLTLLAAETAEIKALRIASLSPTWSAALEAEIARQTTALPQWSRQAHEAEIAAAYRRWTADDMAKSAPLIEVAGRGDTV
ncbi:MAG TPA: hypothetical protein PKZ99_10385 [Azospirillaceae bacterium]|nr:hypothetical protein [Azospirillaceae bacterium]